jgi:pyruvate,water dikinase
MAFHPEVRRRLRTLDRAFAGRLWRADAARWRAEVLPETLAGNRRLQAVDPASLDQEALLAHLEDCEAWLQQMIYRHHDYVVPAVLPSALFLIKAQAWTGLELASLMPLFAGASPVSVGPTALRARLAAALPADAAALSLDALRARGGELADALAAFEAEVGYHVLEGYDLDSPYLLELPGPLRALVTAAGRTATAAADLEGVRERVPAAAHAEFDSLLEEARVAYGLRDERSYFTDNWALGLMRRAVLEAGRRLVATGRLARADHLLEAGWGEQRALLGGLVGPSSGELAARAEARRQRVDAAPHLGSEPGPPPPVEWLPTANARLATQAIQLAIAAVLDTPPAQTRTGSWQGLAASGGVVEGSARVVRTPAELDQVQPGDILVARATNASYNVVLPLLAGLVTDRGGLLSHAAIVAREFGIPAVVGTSDATRDIPDGARIRLDGTTGQVSLV